MSDEELLKLYKSKEPGSITVLDKNDFKRLKELLDDCSVVESLKKPTTEITIDYYEELKAKADFVDKMISPSANEIYKELNELKTKADKWDEKEAPYKPIRKKHRYISEHSYTFDAYCKCGYKINDLLRYCPSCGQKLDWEE